MIPVLFLSHGSIAKGMYDSLELITGDHDNLDYLGLNPDDDLDKYEEKLKKKLKKYDELLILCDLCGGTPYNKVAPLVSKNQRIVSSMNLPMALAAKLKASNIDDIDELVSYIISADAKAVRYVGEIKEAKEVKRETTVSDLMSYCLVRIDSRLLHGQVATMWAPELNPDRIIIVSDEVAHDELRKKLIKQACPSNSKAHVIPLNKFIEIDKDSRLANTKALILFENADDVLKAVEAKTRITEVNIGSLAHKDGKISVSSAVSMDKNDVKTFERLLAKGIKFNVKKVPSDQDEDLLALLDKAKKELGE